MSPKLSTVVPAYNEAARLGKPLQTILSYLNQTREPSELIVVDDGSEDETASVAEENLADAGSVATRVIHYETNRGQGYAARIGLLAAAADVALLSDAGPSTPIPVPPKSIKT